ncbi:hypothetical protein Ddye_011072 [Dipteronia dyeriana]|uniref:RING-type E3 ubiquitin transferase n=1 Tax=Dipteronia dyeriana TaxID=168575 RepID=A0AAD9XEF6_9ROSI|nr:hypothetical protein Ddye_011072 [Dipteronia dyeriana]
MGHRHLFNTPQMFEGEHDQNWNHMHTEQPLANMARAGTADNGSFFYPGETMSVDGLHFTSHWSPASSSNGFTLNHNVEAPHYQPDASGPSHDTFLHPSAAGTFYTVPENFVHPAASSNYDRQTFHGIEGGFVDLTMGNGRGPHKRKSPGVPSVCERGSTSRYYNAESSSDFPPPEVWQEKPNMDSLHMPWDRVNMTSCHRSNTLAIRGEGSMRNVRSRPALDLESNLARAHLSSNPSHSSYSTGRPIDHSSPVDLSAQSSSALTREWSHNRITPGHGRIQVSDSSAFNHEINHFLVGSGSTNTSADIGAFHHDFSLGRNSAVPQSFHGASTQPVRGVRSSYTQRSGPTFRASSSNMRMGQGHVGSSDEGLQLVTENYSSRHPRPLSTVAWRHSDRSGRSRISNERYRALTDEASLRDRFSSEGFMIADRSTMYGSRSMFDEHRDMRLDIDNMTYEELLALGERIGHVSTGLSEDLISKCVTETIYCSSDQLQEEGTCVICLDEYRNMDDVGTMKHCGHDYHVSCIKKWLSMKNMCPICKASVVADNTRP